MHAWNDSIIAFLYIIAKAESEDDVCAISGCDRMRAEGAYCSKEHKHEDGKYTCIYYLFDISRHSLYIHLVTNTIIISTLKNFIRYICIHTYILKGS